MQSKVASHAEVDGGTVMCSLGPDRESRIVRDLQFYSSENDIGVQILEPTLNELLLF